MTVDACAQALADRLTAVARRGSDTSQQHGLLVAIVDGRGGSGKSTVVATAAALVRAGFEHPKPTVVVIDGDEFYAGGSASTWDSRTAEQKVAAVIDWRRQRDVLTSLRATGSARWLAFDWDHDDWDSDRAPLLGERRSVAVANDAIVILEGAYSGRPELADLVDVRVIVEAPETVRRQRLQHREGADYETDWTGRWAEAEELYFGSIVPADQSDLVLINDLVSDLG